VRYQTLRATTQAAADDTAVTPVNTGVSNIA
jgi:hypothetical protein